jgi:hypothetical protein
LQDGFPLLGLRCPGANDSGDCGANQFARRLTEAFSSRWDRVRSFRIGDSKDDTCWFAGDGWWLSTAISDADPDRSIRI